MNDSEKMVLDFDGWLGSQTPDVRHGIDAHLKASGPAVDIEKRRLASMFTVAEETGIPLGTVNERWDILRGGYAEKRGGDWLAVKDDETAFHGRLTKDMTSRRDERHLLQGPDGDARDEAQKSAKLASLYGLVSSAAMRGEPYAPALSAWQKSAAGKSGFDVQKLDAYDTTARTMHEDLTRRIAAVKPTVDSILSGLMAERDGTAGAYGGDNVVEAMMALPADQRGLAQAMLAERAMREGDKKEKGGQFWEAFGRGSAGMLTGTARTYEMDALDDADQRLRELKPGDEIGGRFADLTAYARSESAGSAEGRLFGLALEPLLKDKVATAEGITAAKEEIRKQRERLMIGTQLEQLGKAALDPIKGTGFLQEKVLYPFAEGVLPQLALVAATRKIAPVGTGFVGTLASGSGAMVPLFGMMADQNAQALMRQNPGIDPGQAYGIARNAAYVQTGLEYVGDVLGLGAGSSLGTLLTNARSSAWKAMGKYAAAGAVEQNLTEALQDVLPQVTQALTKEAPAVDWGGVLNGTRPEVTVRTEGSGDGAKNVWMVGSKEFESQAAADVFAEENKQGGYWAQRADTFWSLLPVIALSAGGNTMRSKASRAALERTAAELTDSKLHAMGIPEASRPAILAQTDAVKRLDAVSAALPLADKAIAQAGGVRLRAEQRAQEAAFSEALQNAEISIGRTERDGEPVYTVTQGEQTTEFNSLGAAMSSARVTMEDNNIRKDDAFFDALGVFTETMKPDDLIKVTGARSNLLQEALGAEARADGAETEADSARAAADLKSIWERANIQRRSTGEEELSGDLTNPADRGALENMRVFGKNEREFRDGVARGIRTIFDGGNAADLLEETAEADARAFVGQSKGALAGLAAGVRHIEDITGDKYLFGAETSATAVAEAWSDIVRLSATGTRGGKNKVVTALRSERAAAVTRQRQERDRLRKVEAMGGGDPSMWAKLRGYFEGFRAMMGKAARLVKAREEGKIAEDVEEMISRSVGADALATHEAAVKDDVGAAVEERPAAEGGVDWGATFAIRPADSLDAVASALDGLAVPPAQRRSAFQASADVVAGMARSMAWNDSTAGKISAWAVGQERIAMRRKLEAEKLEAVEADFGDLSGAEMLSSAYGNPVVEALFGEPAKGSPFRKPRLKRRPPADTVGTFEGITRGAEWDGAYELPNWFFGGTLSPDNAAQELYEAGLINAPSPDVMWAALESALRTREASRQRLDDYGRRKREARAEAAAEANAWAAKELADLPKRQKSSERADQLRFLQALDALLMPFPAEVRAKVGGFVKLAALTTNEARQNEIIRRVAKLETAFEDHLRKEYRAEISKILKKGEAKVGDNRVAKGKLTPEIQAVLDKARLYANLNVAEAEAETITAQNAITGARDQAERDRATENFLTLHMTGAALDEGKGGMTAADLAATAQWLEDIYKKGRTGYSVLSEGLREQWKGWRDSIEAKLGKATSDDAKNRVLRDAKPGINAVVAAEETIDALNDLHQQLADILGPNHEVTRTFSTRIRHSREKARMEQHEEQVALYEWLKSAFGLKGTARQSILVSKLSAQVQSPVTRTVGRETATDQISIDLARQIIDGTAADSRYPSGSSQFKALGESLRAYEDALTAFDAAPDGRRPERKYLEIERVTNPGVKEPRKMSMLDAVNDTLLWQQKRYREDNMERHGLGEDYIEQVEKWLSPEAKSVREFIRARYAPEYDGMNSTYRALFNMNMPREENYARASFVNAGMDAEPVGPDGQPGGPGGMSIGSIKGRISHKAEPRRENALAIRMSHVAQISHWKAAATTARDLRAVFSPIEIKNAIVAKHGDKTYKRLMTAIQVYESGGWRDAMANMDAHEVLNRLAGTGIANALGFNIGSIMAQIPAAIVGMTKLGPVAWSKAAAKLAADPKLLAEVYRDTALILRRGPKFSRGEIVSMLTGTNGNIVAQNIMRAGEMGTEVLGVADAGLTSINGAIAYLAHLEAAREMIPQPPDGLTPERQKEFVATMEARAKEQAVDKMRETIEETAQPEDFTRKANFENQVAASRGVAALALRAVFLFKSAARALSANFWTTARQTWRGEIPMEQGMSRLFAMMVILPLMEQVARSAFKDMFSDDSDDELWRKPSTWWAALTSAPASGIPGVGSIVDIVKVKVVGGHSVTNQDPATRLASETITAGGKLIEDGKFDLNAFNWALHSVAVATAGYGVPGGPLAEGVLNLTKSGGGIIDNFETTDAAKDETYRKKQAEKAERERKKELKEKEKQRAAE